MLEARLRISNYFPEPVCRLKNHSSWRTETMCPLTRNELSSFSFEKQLCHADSTYSKKLSVNGSCALTDNAYQNIR